MKYKIQKNFNIIHNKLKKFCNFKLINNKFLCIGIIPTTKKYFIFMFSIKNNVNKSVSRNVLKRLVKESIRVLQYKLINVYMLFYINKYKFKLIIYIILNTLVKKLKKI